ncbi:SixA phosphatase family protein [Kriegella aquimaris]|uniref:Histidine phosphatase superfamily (Branch 1) n=1 Tax=Kriegella aquimaris TaxID=192904 RepID=A0A1G9K4E8_9FLAO|nr:phosphoglycerate mutase family protein [Kriegella aquimaris]SDL44406.1 Histidine phosphatase superfamily (branch 1) [Kriegella aquimaris]
MKLIKHTLFLFLTIAIIGCKDDKPLEEIYVEPSISTFYFIRHAEKDKTDPENSNPELNQKGLGRAMHWAEILKDINIDAIYTTDYKRTTMTAAPLSVKKELSLQYYNLEDVNIQQFKIDNLNKKVLVVGHSNTTPEFVNKMIGDNKYSQMDDTDNGSLYIVQIINGTVTDMRLEFNCNCPE